MKQNRNKQEESALGPLLKGLREPVVLLETRIPLDPLLVGRLKEMLSAAAGREISIDVKVNPRLDVSARLIFGGEKKLDLDLRRRLLEDLETQFAAKKREGLTTVEETAAHLARIIEKTEPRLRIEELADIGEVLQVGDGIAIVSGLRGVGAQEVVRFQHDVYGIAFNLLRDAVGCLLLGPEEEIEEGSAVERTGRLLQIPVGEALIGRIVNALGQPIDGKGPVETAKFRSAERTAPGVVKRHPVIEPLHTGIKIIDALVPLGRGQRELILGDRKIGKTTIAIDTILSQKDAEVICIYAAIGQKASTVARVVRTLQERGAMEYTIVVVAFSNEEPAFRYLVPYAACSLGEEIMDNGGHALVVYDDLSKHAVTYREISALLKRPIGREAYPGDIFYIHSRLLERAARLRDDLGGGSLTALPIVETLAGDISSFIPTNVISICDGQIFLDAGLFNEGFRPPMDVGLSVSRVGGMAQTRAMKKVAGRLRIDLAQYHEMAQFVKFGAEVDQATLDQLTRGEREREVLKQDQHAPLSLEKQIIILYAAVNGYLDAVPLERVKTYEDELLAFMDARYADVLRSIGELKDLSEDTEKNLEQAMSRFTQDFLRQRTATAEVTPAT
ncbi:MAG: F0F1 ATP synthase subunit alpha [Betaproteobacteria bacterium]